jgi:hypothetical protein
MKLMIKAFDCFGKENVLHSLAAMILAAIRRYIRLLEHTRNRRWVVNDSDSNSGFSVKADS